jgi:hypothetical protein
LEVPVVSVRLGAPGGESTGLTTLKNVTRLDRIGKRNIHSFPPIVVTVRSVAEFFCAASDQEVQGLIIGLALQAVFKTLESGSSLSLDWYSDRRNAFVVN